VARSVFFGIAVYLSVLVVIHVLPSEQLFFRIDPPHIPFVNDAFDPPFFQPKNEVVNRPGIAGELCFVKTHVRRFRMEEKKKAVLVGGKKPGKYPDEIRKRAIEMFRSSLPEYGTRVKTAQHICELLGIGTTETVLSRVRQTEVDDGVREGVTSDEREEIRQLRRENAELKRANGILKAASAFFAAELDRPLSR
jgi:transposase